MAKNPQEQVFDVVRKSLSEQIARWQDEKAAVDKLIRNNEELQAKSDAFAELIAEAASQMESVDVQVEAVRVRNGN